MDEKAAIEVFGPKGNTWTANLFLRGSEILKREERAKHGT